MTFPEHFEGPAGTLFYLHRHRLWIVSDDAEVVLPLPDFLAFLVHLAARHAVLLSLAGSAERLHGRLAALVAGQHG